MSFKRLAQKYGGQSGSVIRLCMGLSSAKTVPYVIDSIIEVKGLMKTVNQNRSTL